MVEPRADGEVDESAPPQVSLRLLLPRDAASIPIVRHLSEHALRELGCRPDCASDVGLAITEACANVIQHAANGEVYAVNVCIEADACEISIIESGAGSFDEDRAAASVAARAQDALSESGRGIAIINAVMDDLSFEVRPKSGTLLRMVKNLEFDPDSPARRLLLVG